LGGLRNGEADGGFCSKSESVSLIQSAIVEKLKSQSKGDFKGRHFEAWLIIQAVSWYLRYPLSWCRRDVCGNRLSSSLR
jgi:hypothetical protein